MKNSLQSRCYPEHAAGGFSRIDGTVEFFTRVHALLPETGHVLDLGAGRGQIAQSGWPYLRKLVDLRRAGRVITGLDVDAAVADNPTLDRALMYDGTTMPIEDESVDLIVSDHTFEHIADPLGFCSEIARVLKPGGWVCARTPHFYSALVAVSSLIPNSLHARVLKVVQDGRAERDVFPTVYKLNTARAIGSYFPGWKNCSYTYSPEPAYHFNSMTIFKLMQLYQYVKRPVLGGEVLLAFLQKPRA